MGNREEQLGVNMNIYTVFFEKLCIYSCITYIFCKSLGNIKMIKKDKASVFMEFTVY